MTRSDDGQGAAWARLAGELVDELPGCWQRSRGRGGLRTVLARVPIDWLVYWVGVDRVRGGDPVRVLAGVTPLVEPVSSLTYRWGFSSDLAPWRTWFDLTSPSGASELRALLFEHVVPEIDSYTAQMLATSAEESVVEEDRSQQFDTITQAAGWRVVNNAGSPVGPARMAAERFLAMDLTEEAAWYDDLIEVYERAGRDAALDWLRARRADVLDRLRLPAPLSP